MKKLITLATLVALIITSACTTAGTVQVSPQLKDWYTYACDTYRQARPAVVALLDAEAAHPELIPLEYRAAVEHFRTETAPKIDHSLYVLCSVDAGEIAQQVITQDKAKIDWNAVALETARIASLALQMRANGTI